MDSIEISRIRCQTRIGVEEEERSRRQDVEFRLTMWVDTDTAVNTDSIEHTVDYAQVVKAVKSRAEEGETQLLEALAEKIARVVLGFVRVDGVEVRARKYPTDLLDDIDYVEVTVRRGDCS